MEARELKTLAQPERPADAFQNNVSEAIDQIGKLFDFMRTQKPGYRYVNANSLKVEATDAKPAYLRIGTQFLKVTGDLPCDMRRTGPGGLDYGTFAANTVYYLYAIYYEKRVQLIASLRDPENGPRIQTEWTYLGAFRTDSGPALLAFQSKGGLMYCENGTDDGSFGDVAATAMTVNVPVTAIAAYLRATWTAVNAAGDSYGLGPTSSTSQRMKAQSTTVENNSVGWHWVSLTTPRTIYGSLTHASDEVTIKHFGWKEDVEALK